MMQRCTASRLKQTANQAAESEFTINRGEQGRRLALRRFDGLSAMASLRQHWPEYLMEVGAVGCYLIVACVVTTLLQHPASIVQQSISSGVARRALSPSAVGALPLPLRLACQPGKRLLLDEWSFKLPLPLLLSRGFGSGRHRHQSS